MSNPLHSDYCNCECPEGLSYSKLEETLNRVRMAHVPYTQDNVQLCSGCSMAGTAYVIYPCATMRALEGCKCPPELLYKGDHYSDCVML